MLRLSLDKKKYEFVQPTCHTRLNKFGELSLSNRYENISNFRTSPLDSSSPNSRNLKKSLLKNNASQKICNTSDINPQMTDQVQKIRRLGLIGGLHLKQIKYESQNREKVVYNDYHAMASNPGYSRKPDGGIYPK